MRDTLVYLSETQKSKTAASPNRYNTLNSSVGSLVSPPPNDDPRYDTDTGSELDTSGNGALVIDLDAHIDDSDSFEPEKSKVQGEASHSLAPKNIVAKGERNMNSSVEHQAIVAKGLKMKIKRKGPTGNTRGSSDRSASPTEQLDGVSLTNSNNCGRFPQNNSNLDTKQLNGADNKSSKSVTNRSNSRKVKDRKPESQDLNISGAISSSGLPTEITNPDDSNSATAMELNSSLNAPNQSGTMSLTSNVSVELNRIQYPSPVKDSRAVLSSGSISASKPDIKRDPYDFITKMEDAKPIGTTSNKKCKIEKGEVVSTPSIVPGHTDVAVEARSVGVATEPDCLGPCDPGTSVMLEGIVWQETQHGVLVVNVTWRGKTFVGTLLDATKNEWAPPRFSDSPTPEEVLPSGRSKRRAAAAALNDMTNYTDRRLRKARRGNNNNMPAPASPARADTGRRKRPGTTAEPPAAESNTRAAKRNRSDSTNNEDNFPDPEVTAGGVIECPEPNCNKKYKHINGLRYHQSHAHHEINQRHTINNSDKTDSRPQTPSMDGSSKTRGRRKKRGREGKDSIKSESSSPMEKISTRSSTPNSVHTPTPPAEGIGISFKVGNIEGGIVARGTTVSIPIEYTVGNHPGKGVSDSRSSTPVNGREKKSKKKKSKDKDREHKKEKKVEATSVIIPSHVKGADKSKLPPQLSKQPSPMDKDGPPTGTIETTRPPSSLSVHSPLEISTDKLIKESNGDAQSPAYSDISDANDSTLTETGDQVKIKDEPKDNFDDKNTQPNSGCNNVYNQDMYQSHLRPGKPSTPTTVASSHMLSGGSIHQQLPPSMQGQNKDYSSVTVKQEPIDSQRVDNPKSMDLEYKKTMMNKYAYMAVYNYGIDPAYHQHMMSVDTFYRKCYERHLTEKKAADEQGKFFPSQAQDLTSAKRTEKTVPSSSGPTTGPPPLVSEKDRIKTEPESKPKDFYNNSGLDYKKPKDDSQRHFKYQDGSRNPGESDPKRLMDPRQPVESVIRVKDGSKISDGSTKESRLQPEHRSSPKSIDSKHPDSTSPMTFGHMGYPPGYIAGFGRGLPMDHPMFHTMNPAMMGFHPAAGATPPGFGGHLRHPVAAISGDKPHLPQGLPPPEGGTKALEMLQQHASHYYQNANAPPPPSTHKIHELAMAEKNADKKNTEPSSTCSSPPLRASTPINKGDSDLKKCDSRSPPPQRHLHTHHHTHVVGPYNIYDPYGAAMIAGASPSSGTPVGAPIPSKNPTSPSTVPHPYSSK